MDSSAPAPKNLDRDPPRVLFQHPGGGKIRLLNRISGLLAGGALLPFAALILNPNLLHDVSLSLPGAMFLFAGLAVAMLLAINAARLSRRFVTHLEAWPSSNLLLIRTAGIWQERLLIVSLGDWSATRAPQPPRSRPGSTYFDVRLPRGKHLWFDLAGASRRDLWPAGPPVVLASSPTAEALLRSPEMGNPFSSRTLAT